MPLHPHENAHRQDWQFAGDPDQLRIGDVERLRKRLGELEGETVLARLERLQEMFAM